MTVGDRRFRGDLPGVRVHRVRLARAEVTTAAGIPVTCRERTVVDLLRSEPFRAARDLCDRGLQQRWIDEDSIRRSVAAQPGRTGNRQLRRLLDQLEAGAQAESERLFHRLLRTAGLSGWVAQYPIRAEGRTAYIDVAFPQARLAIEIDGRRAHDELSGRFEDDRVRQNALVRAGWRVLRFTWKQLVDDPRWVIAQIVQLLGS